MTYKLIGTKPNETPDQAVIRCANNLVKAVIAAGYSLHSTSGLSGLDIHFFDHIPNKIFVANSLSGWEVNGTTQLKISFAPCPSEVLEMNDVTPDD